MPKKFIFFIIKKENNFGFLEKYLKQGTKQLHIIASTSFNNYKINTMPILEVLSPNHQLLLLIRPTASKPYLPVLMQAAVIDPMIVHNSSKVFSKYDIQNLIVSYNP